MVEHAIGTLAAYFTEPFTSTARLCIQNGTDCMLKFAGQEMDRSVMKEGGQFVPTAAGGNASRPEKDIPGHQELAFEFHKHASWSGKGEKNQVIMSFQVMTPSGEAEEFLYVQVVNGAREKRVDLSVETELHPLSDMVEMHSAFCSVRKAVKLEHLAKVSATVLSPLREKEMGHMRLLLSTGISEFPKTATTEFWIQIAGGRARPDLLSLQPAPEPLPVLIDAPPVEEGPPRGPEGSLAVGDRVFSLITMAWPRQGGRSVAVGDEGEVLRIVGPDGLVCKFPRNRDLTCRRSEVFGGLLPGELRPGDTVVSTINYSWPAEGRKLTRGDVGLVLGPARGEGHGDEHVRCCFPNNPDVQVHTSEIRREDALPGGFARGDKVFLVVDRSWQCGGEGSVGDEGTVLGPAADSEPAQGRKVCCSFDGGSAASIIPNIEGLEFVPRSTANAIEEDVPVSEICGLLPGGYKPGDRVVSLIGASGLAEGDEGVVLGPAGPGGTRGMHVRCEFANAPSVNLLPFELRRCVQVAG